MVVKSKTWIWIAFAIAMLTSCRENKISMETDVVTLQPAIASNVSTAISTRATVNVSGTTTGTTYDNDETINGITGHKGGVKLRVWSVPTQTGNDSESKPIQRLDTENELNPHRKPGFFSYISGKWHSRATATSGLDYNLYAADTLPGVSVETFNWGLANAADHTTFDIGNMQLQFTGIDIATASDPIVSIAAAGKRIYRDNNGVDLDITSEVPTLATAELTAPTLTKNDYSIGTVRLPGDNENNYYYKVWLAMDHLYSKATIYFAVHQKYNEVRTIRLKKAKIVIDKSERSLTGTHTYSFATSTLSWGTGADFGESAKYSNKDLVIDLMKGPTARDCYDAGQEYVTLTVPTGEVNSYDGYKEFGWFCFLPQSLLPEGKTIPDATLKVEYDVYDKDGHAVRLNQTAENKFELKRFRRDDMNENQYRTPHPGDNYKVKILVKPTYLYKLTDDDAQVELSIE